MQSFPDPNDASSKIWSRLANWPQRYSGLKVWMTTDDNGRPLVYYKPTFGSGELIILKLQSSRIITIIFTTETSTSDGISLGTDLILWKFSVTEFALSDTDGDSKRRNAFLKWQKKKSSNKLFTWKVFNRYAHVANDWQANQRSLVTQWPCN